MKPLRPLATPLSLAAAVSLAACGGGGGGTPASNAATPDPAVGAPPPPAAPAPVSITAIGTITGFGSVWVNGKKYEVAPSTVVAVEDGVRTGDDSGLRMGMKVRISADDEDGVRTATRIDYDDDIEGPIESLAPNPEDPTTGSFVVLGQIITVDSRTTYDDDVGNNDGNRGIDLRDLQVGMIVEVSGYPTMDGFLASRIDRELDEERDDDDFELEGFVEAVAADLSSITVSGIDFRVTSTTELDDGLIIGPDLVGAYVDIEAEFEGGEYIATEIDREDDLYDDADDYLDDDIEIEGVLQAVDTASTPNSFTINGVTIDTNDASALESLLGAFVEIEGELDDNGLFVIDEIDREDEENLDTSDNVASIDAANGLFTTRLGLEIAPTGDSRVEDDVTDDDDDRLTPEEFLARLQVGDRIEAEGFDDGSGNVVWTSVEREASFMDNDDSDCSLAGPVESISGDASNFSLVIQGVTVTTARMDEDNFEVEDESTGRAAFFEALEVGRIVDADSFDGDESCMTGMLDAEELELEDADDLLDD